ncbi:hypothetical protein RN001_012078 [Aquatica leii]|uniref:Uncharacterized protein n=1 Tax=Aquatica leii TaxID=1421715 RepID=A0AAN7S7M4_9COLE|nr:hypothetical protein RN001_012078 [Aquatica leii]
MYLKRKIVVNNSYCIKSSSNKNTNAETHSKRKLLVLNTTKVTSSDANYTYYKAKDENHNYYIIKNKYKKEPLPMKSRAFPESFWQQPNKTSLISPGNVYFSDESSLHKEGDASANKNTDIEEIPVKKKQEIITQPNIDLLFSLFQNVEEEEKKGRANVKNRRGRPKKLKSNITIARDDDPYLTSSAVDPLVSLLPETRSWDTRNKCRKNNQIISMATTKISATTNANNQHFSKMLSDLVVKL